MAQGLNRLQESEVFIKVEDQLSELARQVREDPLYQRTKDGLEKAKSKAAESFSKAQRKTTESLHTAQRKTTEGLLTAQRKASEGIHKVSCVIKNEGNGQKVEKTNNNLLCETENKGSAE